MESVTGAFPNIRRVPVQGGKHEVLVAPWTMAQRRELKPALTKLIERFVSMQGGVQNIDLAALFDQAEDELIAVARATAQLPPGLTWDELYWEDLPNIVQAIWETSIQRADGGGLMGKLSGVLVQAINAARLKTNPIPQPSTGPKSPVSPSSPVDGATPQSA